MPVDPDGFERLLEAVTEQARTTAIDVFEQMTGTDTENLIYSALVLFAKVGQREHTDVRFLQPPIEPPNALSASTTLYVTPQKSVEPSTFDFAVHAYDHKPRVLDKPGWRRLIVECDMSDHQYPIITADDRRALHQRVMRLSKHNITNSAWECAESIFDWAAWTFG